MTEAIALYPEFDVVERVRGMDANQRRHLSLVIDRDPLLAAAPVETARKPLRTFSFKATGRGPSDLSSNADKYLAADTALPESDQAISSTHVEQMVQMPDGSGSLPRRRRLPFIGSGTGPRDLGENVDKYIAIGGYQD